jgi:hypothetical protein
MTPTPPGATGQTEAGVAGGVPPDGGSSEYRPVVRQRAAVRKRRRRRVLVGQVVFTVVAAGLLVALVAVGWRSAMRITGGSDEIVTDPAAPGYVAEVRPTPVTLIAVTGDGEELIALLIVIDDPGTDGVTAVAMSPHTLLWDFEESGPKSAVNVFAEGGPDVLALRLGADLGFGSTETLVVPGSAVVELASGDGPVEISISDEVFSGEPDADPGDVELRYPSGRLELQPEEVDDFLAFTGYRESETARALRSAAVWEAVAGRVVAEADVPDDEDLVAFVELLARLDEPSTTYQVVPMTPVPLNVAPPVTIYRIDSEAMPAWVARNVPFPKAAYPGQLATVALLDGSGDAAALSRVAPTVVGAGAEIALTGNAESFDIATTRVEYHREEANAAAEEIAAALGVTARAGDRSSVDVTVVVGKDRAG